MVHPWVTLKRLSNRRVTSRSAAALSSTRPGAVMPFNPCITILCSFLRLIISSWSSRLLAEVRLSLIAISSMTIRWRAWPLSKAVTLVLRSETVLEISSRLGDSGSANILLTAWIMRPRWRSAKSPSNRVPDSTKQAGLYRKSSCKRTWPESTKEARVSTGEEISSKSRQLRLQSIKEWI